MSVVARLAGFTAVLVLVFALGSGLGRLFGPDLAPQVEPGHTTSSHR